MKPPYAMLVVFLAAIVPPPVLGQKTAESEKLVKMTLHPMAASRPALKYQLLPPFLERRPGNAAVWWNRIPAERERFLVELFKEGGPWDKIHEWMEIPLADPREKALRPKEPAGGRSLYSDMKRAARFESCDWQLPLREGNFMMIGLPEVQQTRTYGRLLAAKARLEMAEGNYAQAVETLQTGFALARDIARGQTLVNSVVGVAIASQMTTQIEQYVQRPEAPNLYWALSALPRPLIDFRPGFETERNLLYLEFPELQDLDKKDLTPEQWTRLLDQHIEKWLKDGRFFDPGSLMSHADLSAATLAILGYPMARQHMIERGRREADVEAMPVAKVVLLYSVEVYQELADDEFILMFVPYAEGYKSYPEPKFFSRHQEVIPFAAELLPAVGAAKRAETRMEWTVAHLRIFEALRIHAAAHDGTLPDRLDDVSEVPIPRNPFDDKPFGYRRDGNRAMLTTEHGPAGLPWRYEITMLPKGDQQ
jgi:hypothetical protein